MLSSIRNSIKGWLAWVIVAIIIVPFALFGLNQYFTGTDNIIVAKVGDLEIDQYQYQSRYEQERRALQNQLGSQYDNAIDNRLKARVISSLITQYLIEQETNKLALVASKEELQQSILSQQSFWQDEQFSLERYQQVLAANGYSATRFEQEEKQRLANAQLREMIQESQWVTKAQLNNFLAIKNQERLFDYFTINPQDYLNEADVDPQRIADFYQENQKQFIMPARAKAAYVRLSAEQLAQSITVSDDVLLSIYQAQRDNYRQDGQVTVAHILLEEKTQANELRAQLNNKTATFAELAKQHSIDEDSANSGGVLAAFGLGIMATEFEQAAFALENSGDISAVVETEFGFHIIKLLDKIDVSYLSFDTVKDNIKKDYINQKANDALTKLKEQLATLSYEYPDSLEEVATVMNLSIQETDWFTNPSAATEGLLADNNFTNAVFSDLVLNKKENSELINATDGSIIVLRLADYQAEKQQTLDEVTPIISKQIAQKTALETVEKLAETIVLALNSNTQQAADLMKNKQLNWQKDILTNRLNEAELADNSIVQLAFQSAKPSAEKPISYHMGMIDNQRYALVAVKKVIAGKQDLEELANYQKTLPQAMSEILFINVLKLLQTDTDIEVFNQYL